MEKSEQKIYALEQAAGSSESEIYLAVGEYLVKHMDFQKQQTLLDIGCGKGQFLKMIKEQSPHLKVTGSDLYDYSQELDFQVEWIKEDLNNPSIESFQQYDFITAIEVIEHLENPRHFVKTFSSLLSKNGIMIITTPNIESFTSLLSFVIRGYHSAFGPKSYPAHITPFAAWDLNNIISETEGIGKLTTLYINNGRMPASNTKWHSLFPFLSGKRFSDNYMTIIQKS